MLALLLSFGEVHALTYAKSVTKRQAFTFDLVADRAELNTRLAPTEGEQVNQIITAFNCPADDIKLYARRGYQVKVLTLGCRQPESPTEENSQRSFEFDEYPLVIVINPGSVKRVENFSEFGFMYQTGTIMRVSDVDRNGAPEFVLGGTVYECDDPDGTNSPCNSEGTIVVEARNGKLVKLKEK